MDAKCPHCGMELDVDCRFIGQRIECPNCKNGFDVVNSRLFPCPDCFSLISKRASVCPKCGAPLMQKAEDVVESAANDLSAETTVATYHPSAMNYLWLFIFGVIAIPLFLIGFIVIGALLIEILCTSYELTSHRIIVRKGWISKRQTEIWIKDMRAVDFNQGVWQRIIGVGDVYIGTAAMASMEIKLIGIAKPAEVVSQINSLRKS